MHGALIKLMIASGYKLISKTFEQLQLLKLKDMQMISFCMLGVTHSCTVIMEVNGITTLWTEKCM